VDWQFPQTRTFLGGSRWRRICHWRSAHVNWWFAAVMPALIWALMGVAWWWLSGGRLPAHIVHSAAWVLTVPQFMFLNAWQARAGVLPRELTYPVRRHDLLLEQAAGILISQYLAWLLLMLEVIAVRLLLPDALAWRDVAIVLAVTGAWQILAFAVNSRLATLNSMVPLFVSYIVSTVLGSSILIVCLLVASWPVTTITTCALLAVATMVMHVSCTHWMTVDLA